MTVHSTNGPVSSHLLSVQVGVCHLFTATLCWITVTTNRYVEYFVSYQTTKRKYSQSGIISPIGNIKSPIGDNIPNWGLGISESGKAESENKSPIPNWISYPQLGISNPQLGYFIQVGIGDLFSDFALHVSEIPNPQLGILSPTGDMIFSIGHNMSNWGYFFF